MASNIKDSIFAKKLLVFAEEMLQESGHLAEDMDEVMPTPKWVSEPKQEQEADLDIGPLGVITKADSDTALASTLLAFAAELLSMGYSQADADDADDAAYQEAFWNGELTTSETDVAEGGVDDWYLAHDTDGTVVWVKRMPNNKWAIYNILKNYASVVSLSWAKTNLKSERDDAGAPIKADSSDAAKYDAALNRLVRFNEMKDKLKSDPAVRDLIGRGILHLQSLCDGATARDGCGFSRDDAEVGHELADKAEQGTLSVSDAMESLKLLRKYQRQLTPQFLSGMGSDLPRDYLDQVGIVVKSS